MADQTTDSYGSARWANAADLASENLFCFSAFNHDTDSFLTDSKRYQYLFRDNRNRALVLGRLADPRRLMSNIRQGYESSTEFTFSGFFSAFFSGSSSRRESNDTRYIGWVGDGHVITIAPTRSGKGVGLVVPNLLHYPGSVLVIDPKGENYAITADFRRRVLRQEIVCLDPFHVVSGISDSINPLDGIVDYRRSPSTYLEKNPEIGDIAANIAEAIIMRDPGTKDPHWDDKARTLIKGFILAVLCGKGPGGQRHLSEVRALLAKPFREIREFIFEKMKGDLAAAGGLLSRAADEILSCGDEEIKSIISNALKHTEFLDSPLMCAALGDFREGGRGTYDLSKLKTVGGVSIYMIIPPHHLARYVRAIRLWVTMAMYAMTRYIGRPADGCPVLFMLDEMAQLGPMDMLRQAVSLLAGYGMSIWMVWQDLSQLKNLYERDWSSFLSNAKIQQFFGINDHETAKYVSEMLGAATIAVSTRSKGDNFQDKFILPDVKQGYSISESWSEITRNLLNPDEVRRLNRKTILTFVQGIPPIMMERISYYEDPMFEQKSVKNPNYQTN